MTPRAVFDCMVFLQAVTNEGGPAYACVRIVEEGELELVISPEVLAEVREVLSRPKLRAKFPHLTDERVEGFLRRVEALGMTPEEVPGVFRYPRDPDDEPYINLAIAGEARYLVSRDKDLLDLMGDEGFRQQFPKLTILDPVALLRERALERQPGRGPEPEP